MLDKINPEWFLTKKGFATLMVLIVSLMAIFQCEPISQENIDNLEKVRASAEAISEGASSETTTTP